MPECYTFVYAAQQALNLSGHTVASLPAYRAGANGMGPFFMYKWWKKNPSPNLPGLASRMLREKTGEYLLALMRYAATPVQQSYALGFLTYYTSSCTINPYFAAMSAGDGPYGAPNGRYTLATALDSDLYYKDYKSYEVPVLAGTPILITEELAQVTALLRHCLFEVYGMDVSLLALTDVFHNNLSARRMMLTKGGPKKLLLKLMEAPNRDEHWGQLHCRTQPGQRLVPLPHVWANPYSGEETRLSTYEVLALAGQTGAVCITTAMRYWLGTLDEHTMAEVLGSNNYITGMPVEPSVAGYMANPAGVPKAQLEPA